MNLPDVSPRRSFLSVLAGPLLLATVLAACAGPAPPRPAVTAAAPAAAVAPAPPVGSREGLLATLWVQSAAEYEAAALQAYAAARVALDAALADPTWTAAPEQEGADYASLPPAMILDVDETVLDNSPYQAWLLTQGVAYDLGSWHRWCDAGMAEPIPGALEHTRYAASRGVTVFYVTNRRAVVLEGTRANLARHGFPLAADRETLLLRGARPDWGSDKGTRRAEVAREFRIVQMVGDNLGDFLSGIDTTPAERAALVERYRDWWGERWIMLPNPMYGSWQGALFGNDWSLPQEEILRREYQALEPWQ